MSDHAHTARPKADQPNIILIMSDQHRGDCLSADGHPAVQTPVIDALAEAGTRFRRAYSTCPSCIPARRALLSGRFPASNGMTGFVGGQPISGPTMPGELRKAGYQTYLVGRTMHQFPPRCRYGYDHMLLGAGYEPDSYDEYLREATGQRDGLASHGLTFNGWNARPWAYEEQHHPTHWAVNEALRFLETRDTTCPFFLTVSFYAPHPPLCPPQFYFDRYLDQRLPSPAIGDWADVPPPPLSIDAARVRLEGEQLRYAQAGYFGLINHIDDQIFRLLAPRIARTHDLRNTVFIYTSDHGEMLGDHHYFRKCEPYEGSARIPLVIRGGEAMGLATRNVVNEPVCLEDLMPTLLDLAGAPIPEQVDGRSLLPLLRGEKNPSWRPHLHGEHAPCYSQEQAHHYLTDGRYKYIWRPLSGREQLFDLEADPQELHDLAPAGGELLDTWRSTMIRELTGRPEGFTDGKQLIAGRPYPGMVPQA